MPPCFYLLIRLPSGGWREQVQHKYFTSFSEERTFLSRLTWGLFRASVFFKKCAGDMKSKYGNLICYTGAVNKSPSVNVSYVRARPPPAANPDIAYWGEQTGYDPKSSAFCPLDWPIFCTLCVCVSVGFCLLLFALIFHKHVLSVWVAFVSSVDRIDRKKDKAERKILDSQERAFWDVHRPVVSFRPKSWKKKRWSQMM